MYVFAGAPIVVAALPEAKNNALLISSNCALRSNKTTHGETQQ